MLYAFVVLSISPSIRAEPQREASIPNDVVIKILKQWETLKPGVSTRADLLKIFAEEGGLSSVTMRTYGYRGSPMIKVDVEFTPSKPNQGDELPSDTISKISRPYLGFAIFD
jgi:hypothetical protein